MSGILERGLAVLEYLAARAEGAPITDVARALDLPHSATHRLLAALAERGYVRQLRTQGDYVLTIKLAGAMREASRATVIAASAMSAISAASRASPCGGRRRGSARA